MIPHMTRKCFLTDGNLKWNQLANWPAWKQLGTNMGMGKIAVFVSEGNKGTNSVMNF